LTLLAPLATLEIEPPARGFSRIGYLKDLTPLDISGLQHSLGRRLIVPAGSLGHGMSEISDY